jgi:hypothetical protein
VSDVLRLACARYPGQHGEPARLDGLSQFIELPLVQDGTELLILDGSAVEAACSRPSLTSEAPIWNTAENAEVIIRAAMRTVGPMPAPVAQPATRPTEIYANYGYAAQIRELLIRFMVVEEARFPDELKNNFLPKMRQYFNEHRLTLVQSCPYYYKICAFHKILALTAEYGLENARAKSLDENYLRGLLPDPPIALAYLDTLLGIRPALFALPFRRAFSGVYLSSRRPIILPEEGHISIFEQFKFSDAPEISVPENGPRLGWKFDQASTLGYLLAAIGAVNNMIAFFSNPLRFLDDQRVVLLNKYLQTQSAIRLLFYDLQDLTNALHPFDKMRAAFNVLDKLANLKSGFASVATADEDVFYALLRPESGERAARVFRHHLRSEGGGINRVFARVVRRSYEVLWESLRRELPTRSDQQRLQYLRTFRNLSHGPFLRRNQWENVFLSSSGRVPDVLSWVALFLVWWLMLAPEDFTSS